MQDNICDDQIHRELISEYLVWQETLTQFIKEKRYFWEIRALKSTKLPMYLIGYIFEEIFYNPLWPANIEKAKKDIEKRETRATARNVLYDKLECDRAARIQSTRIPEALLSPNREEVEQSDEAAVDKLELKGNKYNKERFGEGFDKKPIGWPKK